MSFSVEYSREAKKFIRKCKRNRRLFLQLKQINQQLEKDYLNLKAGQLSGSLKFLSSHKFRVEGIDYRLVFSINKKLNKVYVWLIGVRENFYQKLLRKLA